MLQNFGGSRQQGLYEVGYRIGMINLIVTSSLLTIFWKEISEAKEKGNLGLMQRLYFKACRFLFSIGAILSGFLIPWSKEIISLMLGPSYGEGAPALVVMLIYMTFGSLAQVNGSMLLATNKTKTHVKLGIILMVIFIPISYFILASKDSHIPGLELGAFGLALKMLLFTIIYVNVLSRYICQDYGWKLDWIYQVIVYGAVLGFSFLSFELVKILNSLIIINMFFKVSLTLLLYCGFVITMIWNIPQLVGTSRKEIQQYIFKIFKLSWV
jgi:O-antigen/teichoic acid export membrane protein